MAGKKNTAQDRYTWKKGEVVITDRNGKPIDMNKLNDKPAAKKPKK